MNHRILWIISFTLFVPKAFGSIIRSELKNSATQLLFPIKYQIIKTDIFICYLLLFEGPKRKDKSINEPFLTNDSDGFIHKKRFCKNKKFYFPAKIYEIRQKCWKAKFFISKRSANFLVTIFYRSYIFCLLMKNVIKNKNFWFLKKLYEIWWKFSRQNCSSQEEMQISRRALFDWTSSFRFNCKKRFQKWNFWFCTKSMQDKKKMSVKKIVHLKKFSKLASDYFSTRVISFQLFIKKVFIRIKN